MRYLLAVAGAVALISNIGLAQAFDNGTTTTRIITKQTPHGVVQKRVIVKRHVNRWGTPVVVTRPAYRYGYGTTVVTRTPVTRYNRVIVKRNIHRDVMSGSSVTRVKKTVNPVTGTVTTTRTRSAY